MSLPILRRIDEDDADGLQHAIEDGFDFVGTLHSYELGILCGCVQIQAAHNGHRSGCVQVGLSALRHSRLYMDPKIPFAVAQQVYKERIHHAFDHTTIFIAVHDTEEVVGFCSLRDDEIALIAVKHEHQGKGIGERLIQRVVDECRRRGFNRLKIRTQGSNRQARNFYEKLGFERTKIEKDFYKLREIIMHDPFFVSASARSGSHFFMSLLMSTLKVGSLQEHLKKARDYQDCTDADVLLYFEKISKDAIAGEWGTKVDIRELFFVERYLSLRQIPLDSIRWIWLRRRDKIKQAISHLTAVKTGIWHLSTNHSADLKNRARTEIEIPIEQLNKIVSLYFLVDDAWQQFFEKNKIVPHTIYYEDFIEEPTWIPLIKGVLDFLQIPYTLPLDITTSRVKQSSDTIPVSYKAFINQDLFKKLGYRDKLWNRIP